MSEDLTNYVPVRMHIGSHNGWELSYHPQNNSFHAVKGKKERTHLSRSSLISLCNDADAEALRTKRRIEPCEFVYWNPKGFEEQVALTSFSTRGVALKPTGGETFYIERDKWGNRDCSGLSVLKKGQTLDAVKAALLNLVKAKEAYSEAQRQALQYIVIRDPGYGAEVAAFHNEEDRLRAEINRVGGLT